MASPSAFSVDASQLIRLQNVTSTGKVIGNGSYGKVIEVRVHGTLSAAKEVHAILVEGVAPAEFVAMKKLFLDECINATRIHHPNIVQVLGIHYPTPEAKLPWLVMEMMECNINGFLDKHKKDDIPPHFKLSILVDVCQGLEFLHGQNIIHRDLSSNNVLLTRLLVAKIGDLGVAKAIEHNKMGTLTQTPGTLHFMPPEVLLLEPRYGKPVDVFSLGCVVCHVMSQQWPVPKDLLPGGSMTAITEVQRRDSYLQLCSPAALKKLVESCLQNAPEQRSSATDVCRKLKDLKAAVDKQVTFATANRLELFDVVQQMKVEIAQFKNSQVQVETLKARVKKLTEKVASEKRAAETAKQIYENSCIDHEQAFNQLKGENEALLQAHNNISLEVARLLEVDAQLTASRSETELYRQLLQNAEATIEKQKSEIQELYNRVATTSKTKAHTFFGNLKLKHTNQISSNACEGYHTRSGPFGQLEIEKARQNVMSSSPHIIPPTDLEPRIVPVNPADDGDNSTEEMKKKDVRVRLESENDSNSVKPLQSDYVNYEELISPRAIPAAKLGNPASKRPLAAPRAKKKLAEGKIVEYWKCACCDVVNEAKRATCKKCTVKCGDFSTSHAYCDLCNLLVYILANNMITPGSACPMCKEMLYSI